VRSRTFFREFCYFEYFKGEEQEWSTAATNSYNLP
jgi:hypothetical protein